MRRLDKGAQDFIQGLSVKKSHLEAVAKLREYFDSDNIITGRACYQKLLKLIRKGGQLRRLSYYSFSSQDERTKLLYGLAKHIIQQRDNPKNKRKKWLMPDGSSLNSMEVRTRAEKAFPNLAKKLKTPQNFDRALEQIKVSSDGLIDSETNEITDFIKVLERVTGVKITKVPASHKPDYIPNPESLKDAVFRAETGEITADVAWGVYMLTDKETGKVYVGITRRSFAERFSWHIVESKVKGYTEGSLAERLREIVELDKDPRSIFSIKTLKKHRVMSNDDARILEKECIKNHPECMKPNGYNIKDGGSLGNSGNGLPFSMSVGNGKWYFDSLSQMIIWFQLNYPQLEITSGKVRKRLESGSSIYEALNIDKFYGKKGRRPDFFIYNGKKYNQIREAAEENGIRQASLKSRLHRSIISGEPYRDLKWEKSPENSPKYYEIPHPES